MIRGTDSDLIMANNSGLRSDLINTQGSSEGAESPLMASISALPASASIAAAATQQIAVTATRFNSDTQVVTTHCKYQSSDEGVATVDGGGLVTGVSAGSATITVTYGDLTDTVAITVT